MVQGELTRFMQSVSRCVDSCQDGIKDRITANASDEQIAGFRKEFETCAVRCCDDQVERLPTIKKTLVRNLDMMKQ